MMKLYVQKTANSFDAEADLKTIVPNAMMRRRMSRIVRDGVVAAGRVLDGRRPDALLTATAYGCLADSEKFLRSVIESHEELLPPTPFIQSTFNTVGATIALLQGLHVYNMTYTHGAGSFEAALLDAAMMYDEWGEAGRGKLILAGAVEEMTPTLRVMMRRLKVANVPEAYGAYFFRLSGNAAGACAELELVPLERPNTGTACCDADTLRMARELHAALAGHRPTEIVGEYFKIKVRCL